MNGDVSLDTVHKVETALVEFQTKVCSEVDLTRRRTRSEVYDLLSSDQDDNYAVPTQTQSRITASESTSQCGR